ncbi:unnamed protein product [Ranitomeya imitator]|uniref:UPAR/Ly6 domain-containing protein n=1 Tax=Ranitomeya imitator TaxID=111125 RepID=A0ABN9L9P2_9NEOB|nr:unnamed protein product [Ranitomeya imitator]
MTGEYAPSPRTPSREFIFQRFIRFCAQLSECNATGIYSTSTTSSERIATTCCSENLCTPEKPIVPEGNSTPNGLKCPKCSSWRPSCDTLRTLNCAGDQTMCLIETTKETTGSLNVTSIKRGCASEGFCYKRNESSTAGTVLKETTYSCTRATSIDEHTCTSESSFFSFYVILLEKNQVKFRFSTILNPLL